MTPNESKRSAVLLDGLRSPFGKYMKSLKTLSSKELAAQVISQLLIRNPDVSDLDAVLLAQVIQGGEGQNPARQAAAAGGVSVTVPALTLNNVCLGGLTAIADASRRIRAGEGHAYLVGGMDSMSRARHATYIRDGASMISPEVVDTLSSDGLWCALQDVSMGTLSEEANRNLGIDRDIQDDIAHRSHYLAAEAHRRGLLAEEIAPITVESKEVRDDEGIRMDSAREALSSLKPAFGSVGTITAANASQMSDGASMGILTSLEVANHQGREPLAEVIGYSEVAGPDSSLHLKPARAINKVLDDSGVGIHEVEIFEINEAFAGVVEASRRELSLPIDVINVNGGAIALGHPLGGTGFRLALTAARELQRRGGKYAIASLCGGGGQGAAVLLKNTK